MQTTNIGIGIFLGIVSGIFLGSFALPMKKIKTWNWENIWVLFSFWATIVLPLILAIFTIPNLSGVYNGVPLTVIVTVFSVWRRMGYCQYSLWHGPKDGWIGYWNRHRTGFE